MDGGGMVGWRYPRRTFLRSIARGFVVIRMVAHLMCPADRNTPDTLVKVPARYQQKMAASAPRPYDTPEYLATASPRLRATLSISDRPHAPQ